MNRVGDTGRLHPITGRASSSREFSIPQEPLLRMTQLIQWIFNIIYALIGLRFLLKLIGANPGNLFASTVYGLSAPLVRIFQGLTTSPVYQNGVIEMYDLIALVAYGLIGWLFIKLMWVLFARIR